MAIVCQIPCMRYGTQRPDEEGFYWVKAPTMASESDVVPYLEELDEVQFDGEWMELREFERQHPDAEWCGPLIEPE